MKSDSIGWLATVVLLLAHVAGMIDLVALPVWVGTALIGQYHLSAPEAGGMVTCYLVAAAAASMVFAPKFHRISPRVAAPFGYATAALAFCLLTLTQEPILMFALHLLAGFSAGTGLSFVHGTIGRSARPHFLFAVVTFGLGISGIAFLGVAQSLVPIHGGYVLFAMFTGLMITAALATAVAYPRSIRSDQGSIARSAPVRGGQPMVGRIWYAIAGITVMATSQAMMFSFVERIGVAHGFADQVRNVLVGSAFVNLAAAALAGAMERRLKALNVALGGAVVQAALALIIVSSADFAPYAMGVGFFVSAMIVTHTFAFGWLSAHDSSSRAVALTPAMLMTGAAVGPVLGGVMVANFDFHSLGILALLLDSLAFGCFLMSTRLSRQVNAPKQATA